MSKIEGTYAIAEGADLAGALKAARGNYSFAADGGAVGNINLMALVAIPSGAIVLGGFLEVDTVPTSAGAATIGVQVEGAGDMVAAALISGAPWSTTGRKSVIPAFTGASAVKTTAARDIVAVIGTAALTAGAFKVVLFYVDPLP